MSSTHKFMTGQRVRHVKTGKEYIVRATPDEARIEKGWEPCYVYGDSEIPFIARPKEEMEDGRFELLSASDWRQMRRFPLEDTRSETDAMLEDSYTRAVTAEELENKYPAATPDSAETKEMIAKANAKIEEALSRLPESKSTAMATFTREMRRDLSGDILYPPGEIPGATLRESVYLSPSGGVSQQDAISEAVLYPDRVSAKQFREMMLGGSQPSVSRRETGESS